MKEKLVETLDYNKEDDGYVEFMLEKMNAEEFFNNEFDVDVEKVHRKHVIDLMINFARYYHEQQDELRELLQENKEN